MLQEKYPLSTKAKGSYLIVRASGVRNRATEMALVMDIFNSALTIHLSQVLIDVRKLKGRLSILDSYLVVTEVFQELRGKGINKAALVDVQVSSIRGWFLETVARNRSFNFRIFTTNEDALKWLEL